MDKAIRQIKYSEIFSSFQGEGTYCGKPSLWVRLWSCNFECKGFSQKDINDPSTWTLPYLDADVKKITKLEDLPVFHTGCDSSYSWAKKFGHLAHSNTAPEIAEKLIELNKTMYNPTGHFVHEGSQQESHLVFTGGEPMMNQRGIVDIVESLAELKTAPVKITIETNGTRPMKDFFQTFLEERFYRYQVVGGMMDQSRAANELFWSVSPKLHASGEKWDDAIKPDVVAKYAYESSHGQLKYVVDGSTRTWGEVDRATKMFREEGVDWPVWIMPVGADVEMQNEHAAEITRETIARGYNVCIRAHLYLLGNGMGT